MINKIMHSDVVRLNAEDTLYKALNIMNERSCLKIHFWDSFFYSCL
ncbi:hypothetical protein [Clostridium sp. DJ247]|nr:hypothetical protein [Clostridium sp. DJ247]MBC2580143.1 hypothetical protein [Clostridium sp. DJ247]